MRRDDDGFTLVELIVAMAVLSVAMAGLGAFFVNGSRAVDQQRDHRQAAQLAASAIEQVRALQNSALLTGRGKTAVQTQWNDALTKSPFKDRLKPYLESMEMSSGSEEGLSPTAGADAPISTSTQTLNVNGTDFQQTMFVGACEVYFARTDQCVNPATATNVPADPTQRLLYFRVVVLLSWAQQGCASDQCGYLASTLISRADEPLFDIKRPAPVIRNFTLNPLPVFYLGRDTVSYQYRATGGTLPNTWVFTKLPDGLTGSTTGVISGTPTKLGTFSGATAKVTDSAGRSDTMTGISYTVVQPPALTVPNAPKNHVGETVALQPTVTGGYGSLKWSATGLPSGLSIDESTGAITGTASVTYTAVVRVVDSNDYSAEGTFTHTVFPVVTLTKPGDVTINLGQSVIATPSVSGGDGKFTWSATGLPAGVAINSTNGVISGTPIVPGRYVPTISVTDGVGPAVTDRFVITVNALNVLNFTSPSNDVTSPAGQPVSVPVATNASAVKATGVTTTVLGLPPGVRWNNGQSTLSGTPTTPGTYQVVLTSVSVVPVSTTIYNFVWTIV